MLGRNPNVIHWVKEGTTLFNQLTPIPNPAPVEQSSHPPWQNGRNPKMPCPNANTCPRLTKWPPPMLHPQMANTNNYI